MICLKIKKTREFMNKFLMTGAFSDFLLVEATVITSVTYTVDGRVRKEFYTKEEREEQKLYEFAEWEAIRPGVVQMIKGKHTPLLMKLFLAWKPEKAAALSDEGQQDAAIKNLLCTVKYENGNITLTGGISYQGFTMDKNPEKSWDLTLCRLLDEMELEYEIIS